MRVHVSLKWSPVAGAVNYRISKVRINDMMYTTEASFLMPKEWNSITISEDLAVGVYTYSISSVDQAGNESDKRLIETVCVL